jgi:hypothetical protein
MDQFEAVALGLAVPVIVAVGFSAWKARHVSTSPICRHPDESRPHWSQDGWIKACPDCRNIAYLGDDYDNPPANAVTDDEIKRRFPLVAVTDDGIADAYITFDPPSDQSEVTSTETCYMCDVSNGEHASNCPQRVIDDIFNNRWGANWKHAVMPELFVSRILTAEEIAELEEYPLLAAMAAPPNMGGLGNAPYRGGHYESTHGVESRFVPYDMLGEPVRGTAVHAIGSVACVGPIEFQGENHVTSHHLDTDRAHAD